MKTTLFIATLLIVVGCLQAEQKDIESKESITVGINDTEEDPLGLSIIDSAGYKRYYNMLFGYSIVYPTLLAKPLPESSYPDGRVFNDING